MYFLDLSILDCPRGPQPPGRTAGGEQQVSEASFATSYHSPSLALPPERPSPPRIRGKIVFHETGPWCQKGWGPLIYAISLLWKDEDLAHYPFLSPVPSSCQNNSVIILIK